jgi:SAM-dependent methyltransferase
MQTAKLSPRPCAICLTEGNAREIYRATFNSTALNASVFSARRLPDRIHFRVVKCSSCGLVRSDPIADPSVLEHLYRQSEFTYSDQVPDLRRTYGGCLAALEQYGVRKGSLLEIGCGNGFFLEEALAQRFRVVRGVEPSAAAIAQAAPAVRSSISHDIMRRGLFEDAQFDVICLFQVFDHLPEPGEVLDACVKALRPGGLILAVNHNVEAWSARILGERSPIVDIEHTYLYSPDTMSRILSIHGFRVLSCGSVRNCYALDYLARLLPLPGFLKRTVLAGLRKSGIGRWRFSLHLGNLRIVAQRPQSPAS